MFRFRRKPLTIFGRAYELPDSPINSQSRTGLREFPSLMQNRWSSIGNLVMTGDASRQS